MHSHEPAILQGVSPARVNLMGSEQYSPGIASTGFPSRHDDDGDYVNAKPETTPQHPTKYDENSETDRICGQ